MKKVTLLGVIFLLIAVTAVPVMAANPGNGHGNGNNPGQGNNANSQDQTNEQNQAQIKVKNRDRINHPGVGSNGNQNHMRMRTPFYLQGFIKAVDPATQTLTVELYHGNAQVKQYLGTTLVLQVSDTTMIFKITQGDDSEGEETDGSSNRVPITFDELQVDQNVAIHGNVVDTAYNARLITVYINMPIGQPVIEKP
jgi:Cu/Ag efflux protein CusF